MNKEQYCKGCKKTKEFDTFSFKTCDDCRERTAKIRETKKNNKTEDDICVCEISQQGTKKCTFKKSKPDLKKLNLGNLNPKNIPFINDYCGKHIKVLQDRIDKINNIRRCNEHGCHGDPDGLPTNISKEPENIKRCQSCRDKENKSDKERRNKRQEINNKLKEKNSSELCCVKCGIMYKQSEINQSQNCDKCKGYLDKAKKKIRSKPEYKLKEQRDYKVWYYEKNGKQIKINWKHLNHDKVIHYDREAKLRKRLLLGDEEYLRQNAEKMCEYRKTENWKKYKIRYKKTIEYRFSYYQNRATANEIEFKLTKEEFTKYCEDKCFYCEEYPEIFNGIDRCDNKKGYTLDNCVTACTTCNMMKGGFSREVFILKALHICCFLFDKECFDDKLYFHLPEVFNNVKSCNYNRYQYRANKKNIENENGFEFELTLEDFIDITSNYCYLCGKENDDEHNNGVDRIDNNIGYTLDNCDACCCDCNFMKRDFDINTFIHKISLIYATHSEKYSEYIDFVLTRNI